MVIAGCVCLLTGFAYYKLTQDCPEGNYKDLRASGKMAPKSESKGTFMEACKDKRVWALFMMYGACFGVELTINNIAALYYIDYFGMGLKTAGAMAACFGLMNIFARTLGGVFGDKFGKRWGLQGRVTWLGIALFVEGIALIAFSQVTAIGVALGAMIVFSLFVQMSEGATFSIVPFINKRALGSVAGIVGAGGNFGAVTAGFLFKAESIEWPTALLILGIMVTVCAGLTALVRFSEEDEAKAREEQEKLFAISTIQPIPEGVTA